MSADLTLICSKRGEGIKNPDNCLTVDETSMGQPHTDFGRLLRSYAGGMFGGDIITKELIERVKHWFEVLEHKDYVEIDKVVAWLESHEGEELQLEAW